MNEDLQTTSGVLWLLVGGVLGVVTVLGDLWFADNYQAGRGTILLVLAGVVGAVLALKGGALRPVGLGLSAALALWVLLLLGVAALGGFIELS